MSLVPVYRTDIGALRPVERRADGTIRVEAFLSKCGVFPYLQPDGTIRRELRLPEDVFDKASLDSFEGVVVTNNHPPGMVDAKSARKYAVGTLLTRPTPDDDHMRGRMAVHDHATIEDMEAGKTQVSNGYTCDCEETPGVHPMYGVYDAIQRNIRGNHVAIVDRARAGVTAAARMDSAFMADAARSGMMVLEEGEQATFGMGLASAQQPWHAPSAMTVPAAAARIEVVVKHDAGKPSASEVVDPDDEANRNAKGENDAPPRKKAQPGQMADRGGDVVRGAKQDPEAGDDPDDDDDEGEDSMYDADGKLTAFGKSRVNAATFALPHKKQLPIHDAAAVTASKKAFGKMEFDGPDEKHGAFNRIMSKGKAFGMDMASFEKRHASKLDRADSPTEEDNAMSDTKTAADKAARKAARKAKMDGLEADKARLQGEVDSLKSKVAKLEGEAQGRADAAATAEAARVDAKVELLAEARATGATVDSKMSDRQIKCAVIEHVTKAKIPAEKHDAYVDARYEGAIEASKSDSAARARGDAALAQTRVAVVGGPADPAARNDADDTDEAAAASRMRSHSATAWMRKEQN